MYKKPALIFQILLVLVMTLSPVAIHDLYAQQDDGGFERLAGVKTRLENRLSVLVEMISSDFRIEISGPVEKKIDKFSFFLNQGLTLEEASVNGKPARTDKGVSPKRGPFHTISMSEPLKRGDVINIKYSGKIAGGRIKDGQYVGEDSAYFFNYSFYYPIFDEKGRQEDLVEKYTLKLDCDCGYKDIIFNGTVSSDRATAEGRRVVSIDFGDFNDCTFFLLKNGDKATGSFGGKKISILNKSGSGDDRNITLYRILLTLGLYEKIMGSRFPYESPTIVFEKAERFAGGSAHKGFILLEDGVYAPLEHELGHMFWMFTRSDADSSNDLFFNGPMFFSEGFANFLNMYAVNMNNSFARFYAGGVEKFEDCYAIYYNMPFLGSLNRNIEALKTGECAIDDLKRNFKFNLQLQTAFLYAMHNSLGPEAFFGKTADFYKKIKAEKTATLEDFFATFGDSRIRDAAASPESAVAFVNAHATISDMADYSHEKLNALVGYDTLAKNPIIANVLESLKRNAIHRSRN